jgi:hypothetical protein
MDGVAMSCQPWLSYCPYCDAADEPDETLMECEAFDEDGEPIDLDEMEDCVWPRP